jgi:uncharacterized protein YciI
MGNFKHYIAMIKPIREGFFKNPTEKEKIIMEEHFEYLKNLITENKIQLAGPIINPSDPFGLILFKTPSEEEARILLNKDPSVEKNIQKVLKLEPFRLSLFNPRID